MWVTDPMLDQGIELMQDWGFKFKTVAFYWAKTNTKVDLNKLSSELFHNEMEAKTESHFERNSVVFNNFSDKEPAKIESSIFGRPFHPEQSITTSLSELSM